MENYKVQDGNKTIYFTNKQVYEDYLDYMENGLRIVGKSCGGHLFNNCALVFDLKNGRYSMHKDGRHYSKVGKQYIKLIKAL